MTNRTLNKLAQSVNKWTVNVTWTPVIGTYIRSIQYYNTSECKHVHIQTFSFMFYVLFLLFAFLILFAWSLGAPKGTYMSYTK